jgi:tetratricopeptide (TPR) repeat protein
MESNDARVLERAIAVLQNIVDNTPDGHPTKSACLNNLGNALQIRYGRLGELDDLEQAIATNSRAVELTPKGHTNIPMHLSNFGHALLKRFERIGELHDLEQAVSANGHAVNLTPKSHPHKSMYLTNYGNALLRRFERIGDLGDLELAIATQRRAIDVTPDGHFNEAGYLSNLGHTLLRRFGHVGNLDDLEEAITVNRRAVEITPDSHANKSIYLHNLGHALHRRFERIGELDDLEQGNATIRRAVDLSPDNHPDKPARLNIFGVSLQRRFERVGELDSLEHAISSHRCAIHLTPDGHPDKSQYLNNLGNALRTRFENIVELRDLEQAIEANHRAIELIPDDHPDEPMYLTRLGNSLQARFEYAGELDDLEQAIEARRRAVKLTPEGHTDRPGHLTNLGLSLWSRFQRIGELHDLESTFESFMSAADQQSGSPSVRLEAVGHWAVICLYRVQLGISTYQALFSIYERAFSLIPQVAWLGNSIEQRHNTLSWIAEIVNGAASAAIETGNLSRAVEWLEQGRAVVWGQLLRLRSPLDDLYSIDSNISTRLQSLSQELECLGHLSAATAPADVNVLDHTQTRPFDTDVISRRLAIAKEYDMLLTDIRRRLPGFERFLLPKTFTELVPAANDGPVVLLNVHISRCDALVVCRTARPGRGTEDRIIHVPLPKMTQTLAQKMHSQLSEALGHARVRERAIITDFSEVAGNSDRGTVKRNVTPVFSRVLELLWRCVVQPVLQALEGEVSKYTPYHASLLTPMSQLHHGPSVGDLPHMTWCPTGPLSSLPLHAAGLYGSGSKQKSKVFDHFVSSYAPSLSALLQPLSSVRAPRLANAKILVVSQSNTPNFNPLPGTVNEVANIRSHFLDERITHLDDTQATVNAVLSAIDEHRSQFVHLACHGMQDLKDPMKSAFALYDGGLHLAQLMSRSMDNAELAFLSACQTATGDATLPEEAVHLAAGMLFAGFKAVIGTTWSIGDQDAPLVAGEVYRRLKEGMERTDDVGEGRLNVAYALHAAVKLLREEVGETNFLRWAPFVHFGL